MAENAPDMSYCGFYWHSTRLARKGTDLIFNLCKQEFQKRMNDNKVEWGDVREILFMLKKEMDQGYRNMLWHFRYTQCEKCTYWDDVYSKHLANVKSECPQELTDQEMLEAASAMDGSA